MSLPAAWVDRIFEKLSVVYGRDFMGRWEGLDINSVKSDWSHELSGFFSHPSAIHYALDNLPEKPPTVIEFKRIARTVRAADVPQIEVAVKADPDRLAREMQRMVDRAKHTRTARQWAYDLIASNDAGHRRAHACVVMARRVVDAKELPLGEWNV